MVHKRPEFVAFANVYLLLGRAGLIWSIVNVITGLALAAIEVILARVLQMVLMNLHLIEKEAETPSLERCLFALFGLGVMRFGAQFYSLESRSQVHQLTLKNNQAHFIQWLERQGISKPGLSDSLVLLGDTFQKASLFLAYLTMTVPLFLQTAVIGVACFFYGWKEAALGTAGLAAAGAVILLLNSRVRKVSENLPRIQLQFVKSVKRVLSNWLLVSVSGLKTIEFQKLNNHSSELCVTTTHAQRLGNFGATLPSLSGITLLVLILLVSGTFWKTNGSDLLIFIYLFLRFAMSLSALAGTLPNLSQLMPDFEKSLMWNLQAKFQAAEHSADFQKSLTLSDLPPSVTCKAVALHLGSSKVPIFEGVNINLGSGLQLGIVGSSGSGKSTLLECILGLRQVTRGEVLVGGVSPQRWLHCDSTRIGFVSVEPFLIEGTILDNLKYSVPLLITQSEANFLKKAKLEFEMLGLLDLLEGEGMHRYITEAGEGLSAGQKQRLCLARALLSEPTLLVLDEATANLDTHSEQLVCDRLRMLKGVCTVLIVAHRSASIQYADLVCRLGRE